MPSTGFLAMRRSTWWTLVVLVALRLYASRDSLVWDHQVVVQPGSTTNDPVHHHKDLSFTLWSEAADAPKVEEDASFLRASVDRVEIPLQSLLPRNTSMAPSSRRDISNYRQWPNPTTLPSNNHHHANLPLCRARQDLRRGHWVLDPTVTKAPYITPTVHLRCFELEHYQHSWQQWNWQPTAPCQLAPWNPSALLRLVPQSLVLIAGDSLSWEMYASLIQLLGRKVNQGMQHYSRELNRTVVQAVGSESTTTTYLAYRRDDKLQYVPDMLQDLQTQGMIPTVVVLNRGAHYTDTAQVLRDLEESTLVGLQQWLDQCQSLDIRCHLFWRTTVPGHPQCGNYTEPVNDQKAMEASIGDLQNYDNRTIRYHWYDFAAQNEAVMAWLRERMPGIRVIDAYDTNVLRPDQHRVHQGDCLHSCYPGKMDVFSQFLLHYLWLDRSPQDVERYLEVAKDWPAPPIDVYDKEATEKAKQDRLSGKKKRA